LFPRAAQIAQIALRNFSTFSTKKATAMRDRLKKPDVFGRNREIGCERCNGESLPDEIPGNFHAGSRHYNRPIPPSADKLVFSRTAGHLLRARHHSYIVDYPK